MGLAYAQIGAAEVSRATTVKFNTVCTRCHEGECSGRLSFSSGVAATRSHVRRYLPYSSSLEVEELFAILKYTKEHCAQYPLPDAVPANGVWGAEALRQWRSPDGESYFIPLGKLTGGIYYLGLRFDGKAEASMRITNEKFEVLLEEQQCKDQTFDLTLPVAAEALYYLHLKSYATLLGLTLSPVGLHVPAACTPSINSCIAEKGRTWVP
ncbi:histidinol-phosphate aminotransferase [Sulfuricella sp. T08]|nr:histidinol-phosphate aminotransferase [Sulfuricella sp. T08]